MCGFSNQNGSRLDEAYDCFRRVRDDYERATARGETETETRSRLVDRVLFDCLGWDRSARQELARDGDRLDYLLVDAQSGLNWVVVEAKRAELELVNPKGAGKDGSQAFKLGGPALKPAAYRAIRDQLLPYCAKWGSRIGVLTNGRQWIAALLPPRRGLALEDERAVIFGSLGSVQEEFERFYHFLSSEGVRAGYLEAFLSGGASPVLRCERSGAVVPRPAPLSPGGRGDEDERWFQPLERAIQRSFRPIEEDPRLLERCFVESRESRDAESRMLRLTELLAESLASADEQYGRSIDQLAEEPLWQKGGGVLALLSGQRSAGKTTFLRRFHDFTLPKERKKQLYWLHLQLDRSHEPLEDHSGLARLLARELQSAVFEKATSSLGRGAFFDLYRREWEQYRALYGDEKDEERRFIDEMRGWQQESPLDYAGRLLDYAVERHRRLPVLALDGLDALPPTVLLEALRVARLLFREHFGFFTVVLDDTTIWRLHREHREESRPFFEDLNFRAWLPRPKSGDVLKRRMAYLAETLAEPGGEGRGSVQLGRSLHWNFDPARVASFLRDTFLFEEQEVRGWIEQLANHDLREMLDLCRTLMLSPNLRRERIFAALATGQPRALNRHHILRALIRPRHRNYLPLPQHPVVNVYTHRSPTRGRRDGEDWVPLGPYLLLSYLDEAYREEGTGEGPRGFVELEELYRSAEESLRLPRGHASAILQWLLEHGLVESYDPSLRQLTPDGRLAITQRGRLHLRWAREEWNYLREMGEVDRLCEGPGLAAMREQAARFHEAVREQDQHAMTRASARFAQAYVSALLEPYRERSPLPGPYGRALAALEVKWLREPPATPD